MMQSPDPHDRSRPQAEPSAGTSRTFAALATGLCLLAGGSWWLSNTTTHQAPHQQSVAAAEHQQAPSAAEAPPQLPAMQMALVAPDHAAAALRRAGYPPDILANLLAGIRRREFRLVEMPVFDADGTGGSVTITSGPLTTTLPLTAKPQIVVLPIAISGEVSFTPAPASAGKGIHAGVISVTGPLELPVLHGSETLRAMVIAQ